MNAFDKLCAVGAFLLGLVFLVLGVLGLFAGCRAHFTLPPVLGVLPAFVGWGMVRAIWIAWQSRPEPECYPPTPRLPPEQDYWYGPHHGGAPPPFPDTPDEGGRYRE